MSRVQHHTTQTNTLLCWAAPEHPSTLHLTEQPCNATIASLQKCKAHTSLTPGPRGTVAACKSSQEARRAYHTTAIRPTHTSRLEGSLQCKHVCRGVLMAAQKAHKTHTAATSICSVHSMYWLLHCNKHFPRTCIRPLHWSIIAENDAELPSSNHHRWTPAAD